MEADQLRVSLASALSQESSLNLRRLGHAVAGHACWGTIVVALEDLCKDDRDFLLLFDTLAHLGDARALLLFLSAVRSRPLVLEAMLECAERLPRVVQCALVTCSECEPLLSHLSRGACAAALELAADPKKRRKSQLVHESHIGALRSMRWGSVQEVSP
jgi:hypothetical protein